MMPIEMAQQVQQVAVNVLPAADSSICMLQLAMFLVGALGWEAAAQTLHLDPENIKQIPSFRVRDLTADHAVGSMLSEPFCYQLHGHKPVHVHKTLHASALVLATLPDLEEHFGT